MLKGEFTDGSINPGSEALAHLRRESLDIFNRVRSIAEDIEFVTAVIHRYPAIPVVPNLRCGAWYVDPSLSTGTAAYFKSTDGHTNNWSFNLRRPNVHLLRIIEENDGIIIVDSTRAGKRMPDALSKTVPIWCAVINRAVRSKVGKPQDWDVALYTPPSVVSSQEHRQIEVKLDEWAANLRQSSYVLPNLRHPLRPLWITPASSSFPVLPQRDARTFCPIICVSASRQIHEGLERRQHGFSYVQGSGDDHELWGRGLTPPVFWQHKESLLRADRSVIEALVLTLVRTASASALQGQLPTPIAHVRGRLLVGKVADLLQSPSINIAESTDERAYILMSEHAKEHPPSAEHQVESSRDILTLHLRSGKGGQARFLNHVLPLTVAFIGERLSSGADVCICCDTGTDTSVGVALVALQTFFDHDGDYIGERLASVSAPNKSSISTRLQWVIASRPQANPSRTTLKRINEFLMTPPSLRRSDRHRRGGEQSGPNTTTTPSSSTMS